MIVFLLWYMQCHGLKSFTNNIYNNKPSKYDYFVNGEWERKANRIKIYLDSARGFENDSEIRYAGIRFGISRMIDHLGTLYLQPG